MFYFLRVSDLLSTCVRVVCVHVGGCVCLPLRLGLMGDDYHFYTAGVTAVVYGVLCCTSAVKICDAASGCGGPYGRSTTYDDLTGPPDPIFKARLIDYSASSRRRNGTWDWDHPAVERFLNDGKRRLVWIAHHLSSSMYSVGYSSF